MKEISRQWPVHDFERFCESLCNTLDYVEVKERKDRGKGWDLLVRLINPLTNAVLMEDIPVQCKNFTGAVDTTQPVDDLERCIRNSGPDTSLALLFIVGDLTDQFRKHVQLRQETLSAELNRRITFEVIDQERIAELYARVVATSVQGAPAASNPPLQPTGSAGG